ncbi:divergent polysaccharide deacetylase family protein [[Pseudomonas] carboxydohydrogena]|uniref:Divergent polysaccharide deacetylase family protein n=1 Tax=Afipia carboxydohydrogena TaxID=290 RepID=A0ABY8BNA7_AFICR|nr:divergent polysaccharide deacetylase family protein [[Pseudomonas] carboxydohydrogena]WEF51458.1 divergent polysaccharide deacetylase family protein [[Pseudomonas] carboxydohydrogena]
MTDDLSAPLGQTTPRKRRFRLPFTAPQAIATVCGLFLLAFLGFVIFGRDPMGGEPVVVAKYDPAKLPGANQSAIPSAAPAAPAGAPNGQKTVTIIDGSSGERREMKVGDDGMPAGASLDADAPAMMSGINQRLLENTRYGMVPVAADGLKPWRVYATGTDLQRARAATTPTISIVIGGLGVGAAKTNDAIVKLPAAVTLAFTPYGSDPGKLVERARARKHEVLLQLPMEPYDYPDNDPGPQTLLATAGPEQNVDRLMWLMSRFQGYVGLTNFMGSRFLVTDSAMQPIIQQAAKRGLAWLDDGSVPRSLAGQLAGAQGVPAATADAVVDQVPTTAEIDKSLMKLETLARERGSAVGMASALPISIERIGAWAQRLESRGILLVPLTTTLMKSKSS